jgi:acyl-coenzyme A synthetase/AMP-(fatty) acid ligase
MMSGLPLLASTPPDACIAHYQNRPVTTGEFAAQAQALADLLPQAEFAINLAENRYHFLLAWTAACLRGQTTLLPPSQSPAALTALRAAFSGHHVIDDAAVHGCLAQASPGMSAHAVDWQVPGDRCVAIAFTSGSTGQPQAHRKTWRSLFHNSRLAASQVIEATAPSIVATVPPQHVYGLEASLIGALSAGWCLYDHKPFFPADVRAALLSMPAPRVLVTTPAHLKVLADASIDLPELHRVVSATAPLSVDLARRIEADWHTAVYEIYGCTEAGVMAFRRTTASQRWRTFGEGAIVHVNGGAEYRAPQLDAPIPLQDVIESQDDTSFYLRGRAADMVKVAGKRASLAELTRQVLSVPGVQDAVVLMPDGDARPAALIVAPGLHVAGILDALRQRMEAVFVPRPVVLVDRLPRNELGKLPRDALLQMLQRERA